MDVRTEHVRKTRQKNKRGDSKVGSNDSPEIPDRGETSDIPGLPSGAKIQQAVGPHRDLFTTIKKCKLKWHDLARHGEREKKTKQIKKKKIKKEVGRKHDMREWTGLEFGQVQEGSGKQKTGGNR